jgi:hypothetical protein
MVGESAFLRSGIGIYLKKVLALKKRSVEEKGKKEERGKWFS